jgi:ketosteroid isomerase-like protein
MSEARNTQIVKDAYAAFLRGDIAAILAMVDDAVQWQGVIGTEGVLPQAGLRQGRDAVAEFFSQVDATVGFDEFAPGEFIAQGDQVAVVGSYRGRAKTTGERFETVWVMVFTIRDGKIARFREFTDSAQLVRVFSVPARHGSEVPVTL